MCKETQFTDRKHAENIAILALTFLVDDTSRLHRFLSLTGIGLLTLKKNAANPEVLASALAHLLNDESLLMVFSATTGIPPQSIAPAYNCLSEETDDPQHKKNK